MHLSRAWAFSPTVKRMFLRATSTSFVRALPNDSRVSWCVKAVATTWREDRWMKMRAKDQASHNAVGKHNQLCAPVCCLCYREKIRVNPVATTRTCPLQQTPDRVFGVARARTQDLIVCSTVA